MKMITRTNCDSEDMCWKVSFSSSKGTDHTSGSRSFSGKYYYSASFNAAKSLLFNSWRSNSIKTMFEGLDAKIKWMEKFES